MLKLFVNRVVDRLNLDGVLMKGLFVYVTIRNRLKRK